MVLSGIWKKSEDRKEPRKDEFLVSHEKNLPPDDVQDVCASVGWSRREPELISKALMNSLCVVSIWEDGKIVGFARATGDMVFNATIWDMVVRPSHQGGGVGRLVMDELLKDLDEMGIPLVTLYADPGTDGFYKRFGFLADPSGVRGMFRETG
ncbi:MAG: GNAT family N-acetyltransferase [Candidatus Obscuribacterales bacterium]|nr:GNAT family N-acetyltransferase [Candidatus Obscuribacterales bacterium]